MAYCKRSGYCCYAYDVIIAIEEPDLQLGLYHKPSNCVCPHLGFDSARDAVCAVHDKPWYPQTPCHSFNNPDIDPDAFQKAGCRVGPYTRAQEGGCLAEFVKARSKGKIERLGDWPNWQDGILEKV